MERGVGRTSSVEDTYQNQEVTDWVSGEIRSDTPVPPEKH